MQTPLRTLLALAWLGGTTLGCASLVADKPAELAVPSRDLPLEDGGLEKPFDNGIKLYVFPDASTRLVQFDVRQQVGSREDPDGKTGLAHFVEHLMFQIPVDGPGSPKLMSDLPRHSLYFNAYTAHDETHYMHTGTAEDLEAYMKYTALRLNYDCAAVDEAAFYREREVVRNEHNLRGQGLDAAVYFKMNSLVFPPGHPYGGRSPETEDLHLASITPAEACAFIRKYYTASQATVIITGDVDPLEVLALAKRYLEPLPKIEPAKRIPVPPVAFEGKTIEVKVPVRKPTAAIVFPMPQRWSRDEVAARIATERIFLAVASFADRDGRFIESFDGIGFGGKEATLVGVALETKRAADLDRAIDEVLDAITRGFSASLKGEENKSAYDSARQRARHGVLAGVAAIESRAGVLADFLESGQPGLYAPLIHQLDFLDVEQVQVVGRRVFAREKAIVVKVVPDGSKTAKAERANFDYKPSSEEKLSLPEDVDPAEAEHPLPLQDIVPADGQSLEFQLDNGMHVVLVTSSRQPVMELQLIVGAGEIDAENPDVAALVATSYRPNYADVYARGLAQGFDLAGGYFEPEVFPEATTFNTRGLAIYLDFLVAGLSEFVVQAEYVTERLDYWKEDRRERLKKKRVQQNLARQNRFFTELFGDGHPHARPALADARALKDIRLADLETFRATHYRAANSTLIITGGFDLNLAIDYVTRYFGQPRRTDASTHWQDPRATNARTRAPEPRPGKTRVLTQINPELAQTIVTVAYPLAEIYGEHHAALDVLATMLNHDVGRVRHELGASYGVYARLATDRPRIEIGGPLDSRRAGEAFAAIKDSITKLRDSEDFNRLFAFARREALREQVNQRADPKLLAESLARAIRNGQSYEYFEEHARRIATLTPDQVRAEIERVLVEANAVTLVQGPRLGVENVITKNGIVGAVALPEVTVDDE